MDIVFRRIETPRLGIGVRERAGKKGEPVLFIHGNASSSLFWAETLKALPEDFKGIACDLRGYGDTDPLPVSAPLGLGDMVEDVLGLIETEGLAPVHIAGHSMGCGVAMKLAIELAPKGSIRSLALIDPVSPFGFSGTKDEKGTPCFEDGAPAGAGGVSPEFVQLIKDQYSGTEKPMAPLNVLRQFYFNPPYVPREEEDLLKSLLSTRIGEDWYPGDALPSLNWPGTCPGKRGVVNAFSGKYFNASAIADAPCNFPILWVRGGEDKIVSNNSLFDVAVLGSLGVIPGWPGMEVCPPQPMIDQTEYVLARFEQRGGIVERHVIPGAGHSPFIEKPDIFNPLFHSFLKRNTG